MGDNINLNVEYGIMKFDLLKQLPYEMLQSDPKF